MRHHKNKYNIVWYLFLTAFLAAFTGNILAIRNSQRGTLDLDNIYGVSGDIEYTNPSLNNVTLGFSYHRVIINDTVPKINPNATICADEPANLTRYVEWGWRKAEAQNGSIIRQLLLAYGIQVNPLNPNFSCVANIPFALPSNWTMGSFHNFQIKWDTCVQYDPITQTCYKGHYIIVDGIIKYSLKKMYRV